MLGQVVAELIRQTERKRWHGLRLLAVDCTTLTLPETHPLWKRFKSHRGKKGLGPVAVEFACLFHLASRAPVDYCLAKAATSDHVLIKRLIPRLKKSDLLLIDSGFYSLRTFLSICRRKAEFLIPAKTTHRPRVVKKLAVSDYLCRLESEDDSLLVRVIFVERRGFRRRRLVTSLVDSRTFPAVEVAELYHLRWSVETFYRDFKQTLGARHWHCRTPRTFEQELISHLMLVCLIRGMMAEAAGHAGVDASTLSFARCLAQVRVFFRRLGRLPLAEWKQAHRALVHACSCFLVSIKPGRAFSRDRQECRRKARGLEPRPRGRKPSLPSPSTRQKREVRSDNCLLP